MDWLGREQRIQLNRIRNSIAQLGPLEQSVVRLRYIEGLTHAQIAAQLELTIAAVDAHIHHAKDELRRKMKGER